MNDIVVIRYIFVDASEETRHFHSCFWVKFYTQKCAFISRLPAEQIAKNNRETIESIYQERLLF